ncbi:alginate export family protein [Aquimarina sp. 2201CG5-10]|uniref:alginate export family protein n=1 Tax=Aquimarina callyspongiae TaxID=3098150 RepID=UPI002AB4AF36|nr:alginate export family protein [Aquimarina sp. 2201CG5-10]MDY8138173.1 alginate export family protein [Aquimarina sp. 2201CG5-10]
MKNKLNLTAILIFFIIVFKSKAQELSIDADIRPRLEYSHGFGNLIPSDTDAGIFVQQRSRLKFIYKTDKFSSHISVQDVSVWGDTPQISAIDGNNSFSLAQAWINLTLGKGWSTKLGRQVLSYDDQRILGGLDWAMQGRFHDAALIQYKNQNNLQFDVGFAFNQNGISRQTTLFDPNNDSNARAVFDYKGMIYTWIHKDWQKISGSLLFVNNSYQNLDPTDGETPIDGTIHRQTFGTHIKVKPNNDFSLQINIYGQTGDFTENINLSAYNALLEIIYKPRNTIFAIGGEILSGDNNGGSDGKIESFFPIFGTNHKFNGYMDYFYVGNHANNVGLQDIYAKAIIKTGKQSNLLAKAHYFNAAENITGTSDKYLGTELDLVFTQQILPYATLKLGYSHMFEGDNMQILKGVTNPSGIQNWGWAMLVVQPNFLKWNPTKTVNTP